MEDNHRCLCYKQLRIILSCIDEAKTENTEEENTVFNCSEIPTWRIRLILRGHAIPGLLYLKHIYPTVANIYLLKICGLYVIISLVINLLEVKS